MNEEQFDDQPGLIDEDPALDYILYETMEKENKRTSARDGCLSLVSILLVPFCGIFLLLDVIV